MAKGDIQPYNESGRHGSRTHQVASGGSPPAINVGEPVTKTLGNQYVTSGATSKPVVATDFVVGISAGAQGSAGTSTETASVAGVIDVYDFLNSDVWLISPKVATTWATQALYNALVGARVTWDKTNGVYTINAADGSTNGLVVENLQVATYPAKVAFSIRAGASYLA